MAYKKSPGPKGIPKDAFKNLDSQDILLLRKTILKFRNNPQYNPEAFTRLGLCILQKTGDLSNPIKWRGIVLGDFAAKVISLIISTRLTKHIITFDMDEQYGSLFGKGCADATLLRIGLHTKASKPTLYIETI